MRLSLNKQSTNSFASRRHGVVCFHICRSFVLHSRKSHFGQSKVHSLDDQYMRKDCFLILQGPGIHFIFYYNKSGYVTDRKSFAS
jgi:hypothetical protein